MKSYYSQSKTIFKEIKKAQRILLNVHRSPDLDSCGSSLTLYQVIKKLAKKVEIVSPQPVREQFLFLKDSRKIKKIDFSRFDFSSFNLFIILDSSSADMVTGSPQINLPKIPMIIIDHHKTNKLMGKVRLIDEEASAVGEIIYQLFQDWKMSIDKETASNLFSSIATDTVFLKYPRHPQRTFAIVYDLIKKGADMEALVKNVYNNYSLSVLKLLGLFLQKMSVDKKGDFVWAAVSHQEYESFGKPKGIRELAADQFFQSVGGVEFGMVMLEEEKGKLGVSFRSKGLIDVSKLAEKLSGGGHRKAAGATLYGNFEEMVSRVIKTARAREGYQEKDTI
jgi:phosphoesterase RecJ-like protein